MYSEVRQFNPRWFDKRNKFLFYLYIFKDIILISLSKFHIHRLWILPTYYPSKNTKEKPSPVQDKPTKGTYALLQNVSMVVQYLFFCHFNETIFCNVRFEACVSPGLKLIDKWLTKNLMLEYFIHNIF